MVITAVHGFLGPQAMLMVTYSDLIVAAEGTSFSLEQIRAGGAGGMVLGLHLLGMRKLKGWQFLAGRLTAEEAERHGFINEVVPMNRLYAKAQEWAETILFLPSQNVVANKRASNGILDAWGIWPLQRLTGLYGRMGHGSEFDREFFKQVLEKGLKPALGFRDPRHGGRPVGRAGGQG